MTKEELRNMAEVAWAREYPATELERQAQEKRGYVEFCASPEQIQEAFIEGYLAHASDLGKLTDMPEVKP